MSFLINDSFRPPPFVRNSHVQTILPTLVRRVPVVPGRRERLELPDGDFLDLDFQTAGNDRVALLCHGLEGDSNTAYMRGMARALNESGWDTAALNFRGCSGEPNRMFRSYHAGFTDDIAFAVEYLLHRKAYRHLTLIGFSLGGNAVLKYLGESTRPTASGIDSAIAISVPCDLEGCARQMSRPANRIYMTRFMRLFRKKLARKRSLAPADFDWDTLARCQTFADFDDLYTAPVHGFANAASYWQAASCLQYLDRACVPTLIINALDDPFLSAVPELEAVARQHRSLHLEQTRFGGHLGFFSWPGARKYWHERRAMEFLDALP